MQDNNDLYYVPMSTQNPNSPSLEWGKDEDDSRFFDRLPTADLSSIELELAEPEPHKPEMEDYHPLLEPVISDKIKDIIEPLDLFGVQYIPANVNVNGNIHKYWFMYITNQISGCLDMDKSEFMFDGMGDIMSVQKIILDNKRIEEIPLERRLVFNFSEFSVYEVFHQSIVEKIMAKSPTGIKFWSLNEWTPSAFYK